MQETHQPISFYREPRLRKAGDRYEVVWYDAHGVRQRKYMGKEEQDAKQKAEAFIRELKGEAFEGTLLHALDEAFEIHRLTLREYTATIYRHNLNAFKRFLENTDRRQLLLKDCDEQVLEEFRVHRLQIVQAGTVKKEVTSIKVFFNILINQGKIKANLSKIRCKKGEQKAKECYTAEDLEKLFATAKEVSPMLWLLYGMVYYAYIRPAEITRLQWRDVDFKRGRITIPGDKSKNGKTESVPIVPELRTILEACFTDQPNEYVLNERRTRSNLNHHHKQLLKKAGITRQYQLYALKHTGARDHYEKHKDLKRLQRLLRHSSSTITDAYLTGLGEVI